MKSKETKKFKQKNLFFIGLVNLIALLFTYVIIPVILNYPPYVERDLKFQNEIETLNHPQKYIIIFIFLTLIFYSIINILMKNIYSFIDKYYSNQKISFDEINNVRKDCLNIPYIFYISEIILSFIIGIIIIIIHSISNLNVIKLGLFLVTLLPLIGLLQFIFFQKSLKKINLLTYSINAKYSKIKSFRIKFSSNLILQIVPFLLEAIIVISLVGYAKTTNQNGISTMNYYKSYFNNRKFETINLSSIKQELDSIPLHSKSDYYIIITPNKEYIYTSNSSTVTNFFLKYLDYYFDKTGGMIYEYYGSEQQAYMINLVDENHDTWYVGFEYSISDTNLMLFYIHIIFGVTALYIIFIYLWSKNTSTNISTISESLKYVVKEIDYTTQKYLPILSNDEFGDLAYAYNKIEERTNRHLKKIQNNQDMLIEQERLASLRTNDSVELPTT